MLELATGKDPESGEARGFVPHTQPCGVTAAALHHNAVSRDTAKLAAGRLQISPLGGPGRFGVVSAESSTSDSLKACTALKRILWFELNSGKPP